MANISTPPPLTPDNAAESYAVIWAAAPVGGPAQAYVMGDLFSDPMRAAFMRRCASAGSVTLLSDFIVPLFQWASMEMDTPLASPQSTVCRNSWSYVEGTLRTNSTAAVQPGPENGDALFLLSFQWQQLLVRVGANARTQLTLLTHLPA